MDAADGKRRCFVLGSGPSIKGQDLRPLSRQTTFCTNWFLNHPDMDRLDIDYYCVCDQRFVVPEPNRQWIQEVGRYGFKIFLPADWQKHQLPFRDVTYISFHRDKKVARSGRFSTDLQVGFFDGDTVIISMCLPLAMAMGFNEIVLLGCDCQYGISDRGLKEAYFYDLLRHPTAFEHTGESERCWQTNVFTAYGVVRTFAEERGVRILNATEGGMLEVFDRVSLQSVLTGS